MNDAGFKSWRMNQTKPDMRADARGTGDWRTGFADAGEDHLV